ncbi:type II toxin-antitoxin system VapC family toxin [Clostridium senegalense]|uniref:type II toxin-antitoxin system VapC family toxin n=1 Tax=Clostridium senegalense TaxID=1465809 RepID=UPI001C0FD512|nr:PIN domain-containing protein [Clostridium senegalense]MBU5227556.1 PIN domain-containing protein [Clostridium senegalense]
MEMILYPFKGVVFDESTSILLDASFLLSLVYDDDPKHSECIEVLRKIMLGKSILYITSIISCEVLNQIMYKVFMIDVQYKITKATPFNTPNNIKCIISTFNKYDRKSLKEKRASKVVDIPYKKYFDNLSKNALRKNLLNIYYKTAVNMHTQLEHTLKFNYLDINDICMIKTKELMMTHNIAVNDATILAAAECYNINFLLTLDSDFLYADTSSVQILKI